MSANWEEIKSAERSKRSEATGSGTPSVLDGVAFGQPALSLAAQLQRRAERAGVPLSPDDPAHGSMPGAAADSAVPAVAVGDELMRLVAQARSADADPEFELRAAARRFAERVRDWERSRQS